MAAVSVWDWVAVVFAAAFVVNAIRKASAMEPDAPAWEKAVNIKLRRWTWLDSVCAVGFVGSLILGGNGDVLLHAHK